MKKLGRDGLDFLYNAICVLRGDKHQSYVDFDPETLYAPVATQKNLRALFAFPASMMDIIEGAHILVEGAYITNAYLFWQT